MTREELIKNLKYTMKKHENDRVDTFSTNISLICKDMLDYLEQEPCNDAISRQEVIERLKKEDKILYTTKGLNYLIRAIEELPSVTQKSETVTEFADRCRECGAKYGKLLKQEPCSDAVSRDMALEKMANYVASGYADSAEDFEEYSKIICQLPHVNPQPKTGHWIPSHITESILDECSECGFSCGAFTFNYCPNCGARMESE